MKHLTILAFLLLSVFTGAIAQTGEPKHKLVMQLNSNDTLIWKGLMNNLKNLKAGWGDSVKVEVVVHGPGVQFMMKEKPPRPIRSRTLKRWALNSSFAKTPYVNAMSPKNNSSPKPASLKWG